MINPLEQSYYFTQVVAFTVCLDSAKKLPKEELIKNLESLIKDFVKEYKLKDYLDTVPTTKAIIKKHLPNLL